MPMWYILPVLLTIYNFVELCRQYRKHDCVYVFLCVCFCVCGKFIAMNTETKVNNKRRQSTERSQ